MWGEFKESIPAAVRPWLAPAVLLALLGLVWTVGVGHGETELKSTLRTGHWKPSTMRSRP